MKNKIYINRINLIILLTFLNCKSLSDLFRSGNIDLALKSNSSKATVFVGKMENRGKSNYSNLANNFSDLLKFHFLKKGFHVLEEANLYSKSQISLTEKQSSEDIFSSIIKDIDNKKSIFPSVNSNEKLEIQELSSKFSFDYYITGSIGNYYSNNILEESESTIAIIKIYNKNGEMIGISNFSTEHTSNPIVLRLASEKIVSILFEKLPKGEIQK